MPTPRVPIQTPFFDEDGGLTRPWMLFFERLGTGAASGASTGSNYATEVALPAGPGTTEITSPIATPSNGDQLTVRVEQEAVTGGRQISFSAEFAADTPVDIPMAPGAVFQLTFSAFGSTGKWHFTGLVQTV